MLKINEKIYYFNIFLIIFFKKTPYTALPNIHAPSTQLIMSSKGRCIVIEDLKELGNNLQVI